MTEIDNDKLLKDFFAENKREIADNGFSRRVMHHLPDRSNRLARLWTVFVMAVGGVITSPACTSAMLACQSGSRFWEM